MRYVAFLRAINVGGHTVKMDRLKKLFEEIGLTKVETFIASGNVIFDSRASAASLEKKIEAHLQKALGYAVDTFVRPIDALPGITSTHPFLSEEAKAHGLYIAFLKSPPAAEGHARVNKLTCKEHRFHVNDRELYWLCYDREAVIKMSGATLEKALGGSATVRNVSTVRKLAKKLGLTA
jgi:uncharacterized protein (DUF1697 family)